MIHVFLRPGVISLRRKMTPRSIFDGVAIRRYTGWVCTMTIAFELTNDFGSRSRHTLVLRTSVTWNIIQIQLVKGHSCEDSRWQQGFLYLPNLSKHESRCSTMCYNFLTIRGSLSDCSLAVEHEPSTFQSRVLYTTINNTASLILLLLSSFLARCFISSYSHFPSFEWVFCLRLLHVEWSPRNEILVWL